MTVRRTGATFFDFNNVAGLVRLAANTASGNGTNGAFVQGTFGGAFELDWPEGLVIHDLRKRFPWPSGSARAVYSSHTLEHLSRDQGRFFLQECARVLKPGGVLRIVVPDLAVILRQLEKGELRATQLIDALEVSVEHPNDPWWKRWLAPYVRFPHRCMYDAACLVDPYDVASIRAGIERVIEDAEYRAKLVEAGLRNAERFRPKAIADQYARIYRRIAAENAG